MIATLTAKPFINRIAGPAIALVSMAVLAGVGRTVLLAKIRSRYSKAMISPEVPHHVIFTWHMAVDALYAGLIHIRIGMVMMFFDVIALRRMTRRTDIVAFLFQPGTVRIMTVPAVYAVLVFTTLKV